MLDNFAGVLIGYLAVVIGGWATGQRGGRVGGAVVTTKESEPAPSLVNAA